uniref:C-type lectin domain-containing protein n=1 Tax=Dromaius novaehollandiae TaxID=8790 RepID=A0A8C4KAK3_DRONO
RPAGKGNGGTQPACPGSRYGQRLGIYYFSTDRKPWQDAEDFCVSTRSHLASITSAEEQVGAWVGSRGHWIGLTDAGTEGTWRWVGGTEYSQNMR